MTPPARRPQVLLVCPGLDHAHRGFETFARECFTALHGRDDLDLELIKGSGPRGPGERAIPTLTRRARTARWVARRRDVEPYIVEHVAFAAALLPLLARRRPDVVYFSEWHVGRALAAWRRRTRARFALVFCNGALVPTGYERFDRVQQLVPGARDYAVAHGEDPERQVVLPLGVAMPDTLGPPGDAELRAHLGLPAGRRIVLSAGAINRQKRIDYLVEEIAALPEPRPYLLLAGQQEAETPALRRLAQERLGPDGHDIRTVAPEAMPDLYRAADAFVLASLWESFGRVLVEALSHGLPCLAHDYPVMRWVLGDAGEVADLEVPGALGAWLQSPDANDLSEDARRRRHQSAYKRFSWGNLADRYAALLQGAAADGGEAWTTATTRLS